MGDVMAFGYWLGLGIGLGFVSMIAILYIVDKAGELVGRGVAKLIGGIGNG